MRQDVCTPSQLIKESKQSNLWFFFDFFNSLIIYVLTLTSYLNKGQWKTDKDCMVLGHMAKIPFPVLCECRNVSKTAKTNGLKRAKMTK